MQVCVDFYCHDLFANKFVFFFSPVDSMASSPPLTLLSAKLAPFISLDGHKFSDPDLVDDIALLLVIVDILDARKGPMKIRSLLAALKERGIKSEEFFGYGR